METGLEKPAQYLLEVFGPLAIGWVFAAALVVLIAWMFRWILRDQAEQREASEARARAYHEVVKENTETMVRLDALFQERTREILDELKISRTRGRE